MADQIRVFPQAFDGAALVATLGPLADGPGWEEGRQQTGYRKLDLRASGEFPMAGMFHAAMDLLQPPNPALYDHWLLHYRTGDAIPPHYDPPMGDGLAHWRLNVLVEAGEGGMLYLNGAECLLRPGDAVLFRPDRVEHAVAVVTAGRRLVWSLGTNRAE